MDQTANSAESTETPNQHTNLTTQTPNQHINPTTQLSFNDSLISLFGQHASTLAKTTSHSIEHMAINSCHISFLKACRDHSLIPKGLRLTNPLSTKRSTEVLTHASNLLITERLNHYRLKYAQHKRTYEHNLRHIESLITPQYFQKLGHLNTKKSSYTHRKQLLTHQKKFAVLLSEYDTPFLSPYDTLKTLDIPSPTFHGPLLKTSPTPKKDTTAKTVINLSGQTLSTAETDVLSLGLKFVPTPTSDPTPDLAPLIQNITKQLGEGMEASATYQVTSVLSKFDNKRDMTTDNLTPQQRTALKSLKSKKSELKFLPADKGNATVVLTHDQYITKVTDHLSSGSYTLLTKDPTQSVTTKLQKVLKKLHTDKKITTDLYHKMRNLHPRWPQLYGQPKIHKPGAPIRPVVSFYNTPLQALHKVLASFLKPLAQNPLRLKDSSDFKHRFDSSLNPSFHYHASLDVQSLYTSCDMRLALKTVISSFEQNPSRLPSNVTTTTIGSLINFCLDNSYLEFNGSFYSQDEGGTMGSPLIVELAEIRLAEIETLALSSCPDPPNTYSHFVDDGLGSFRDRNHAESFLTFLNSLTEDLNFTQEHPSTDGTIPFLDVLIHPDKSTSVYRKPTHTNLYTKYSSCTTNSSKNAVIRSLTRRAHNICSPQHLDDELQTVRHVCLQNVSLPFHPSLSKPISKILGQHDIKVTHSSATSLRNLLTKTKTTPPTHLTPNTIYEISCSQCPSKYAGQT
ncbi:uncharacterized protein LOC134818673 [Bolinopsis microptera]|uniref:uncharacterized protein LOC134818673 n=1 Tax=Bolinopsis microptera TaxID=2820187 RepID=UPI003079C9BA